LDLPGRDTKRMATGIQRENGRKVQKRSPGVKTIPRQGRELHMQRQQNNVQAGKCRSIWHNRGGEGGDPKGGRKDECIGRLVE